MSGSLWDALGSDLPLIWRGVLLTLILTIGGSALAVVLAVILGLTARVKNVLVRGASRTIIEFFRGTSLVVQLFWLYFVLPQLGVEWPAVIVAIAALGLNYGSYGAEVVRGSINSVPTGQWEAATALSLSTYGRMRRVIFPQAWALMIPSLTNLLIQLLKGTAIVMVISLIDTEAAIDQLRIDTGNTFFAYTIAFILYFVMAYLFTLAMNAFETQAKHKLGRGQSLKSALSFRAPTKDNERAGVSTL